MTHETPAAVDAFVAALREPSDEQRDAALALVTDAVEVRTPFGGGEGRDAAAAALANPRVLGLVSGAAWAVADAVGDDALVRVTATTPPGMPVGGLRFGFALGADGRIARVEQDLVPAAARPPVPVELTEAHRALLRDALDNGTTPIVAYVDADGRPHQSYRATVQVLDRDRLALWIRDPNGGLLRALGANPSLSIFYSDRTKGITLQFHGRGRVTDDDAVRVAVYDASPRVEQDMDWRRRGVAVVVDIDRVEGRDASGPVRMAGSATSDAG